MNAARSNSPGLMLPPHAISEDVHGAMEGRRNNDDGEEAEEPISREEPRDGPRGQQGDRPEGAEHEVVLVEARSLRAPRPVQAPLDERPAQIAEERTRGKECGREEGGARGTEGPRGSDEAREGREGQADDGSPRAPASEAPPGLPLPQPPPPLPHP